MDKRKYTLIGTIIIALILIASVTVWCFYLRPVTCNEFLDKLEEKKYKVGDVVKIRDKVDFVSVCKLPELIPPTDWSHGNITLKPNGEITTYTKVGFESTPEKEDLPFTGDRRNDFQVGSEVEFSVVIKEINYAGTTPLGCAELENAVLFVYYAVYQVGSGDYNVMLDANISENGSVCKITVTDVKNPILGFDVEKFQINDIHVNFWSNTTPSCDIPLDTDLHILNDYDCTIQFFDTDANGILSKEDYFVISNCKLNDTYNFRLAKDGNSVTEKSWINV